jgi:hypothetical protein
MDNRREVKGMKKRLLYGFVALICIALIFAMKLLILETFGIDISAKTTKDYVEVVVVAILIGTTFALVTRKKD